MNKDLHRRAHTYLAHGRSFALNKAPYYSSFLVGLVPRIIEDAPADLTLAVSKRLVLYVNPHWLLSDPELTENGLPNKEVIGACLVHEVEHLQRGMERLEALPNKKLASYVGDFSINADLRRAGWKLPTWVLYPEKYGFPEGKPLEWYYNEISKLPPEQQPHFLPGIGAGGCGSCSGTPHNSETDELLFGRDQIEVEQIKHETYEKVKDFVRQHGVGSVPGFSEHEVPFKKQAKIIPWERQLAHIGRYALNVLTDLDDDFSYAHISRRSQALGIIRPGPVGFQVEMGFIRDSSASMGEEEVNVANNQIIDVMKTFGLERVLLLDADTQIHGEPQYVRVKDIPRLTLRGRGGTDFRKPLAYIEKMRNKPRVLFYLTDSWGTYPEHPPRGVEVIWCVIPNESHINRPPWGKVVICSNDPEVRRKFAA